MKLLKDTAACDTGKDLRGSAVTREQLEPVLIALAVIDARLVAAVDDCDLSPGAAALLAAVEVYPATSRLNLLDVAQSTGSDDALRLADRSIRLTLSEIVDWSPQTVVALIKRCEQTASAQPIIAKTPPHREKAWQAHLRRALAGAA